MRRKNMESHEFYCTKCGNRGIPLPRTCGRRKERHHLKVMYCIYCKDKVNHVECKTYEDVVEFKEKFEEGWYLDDAEDIDSNDGDSC